MIPKNIFQTWKEKNVQHPVLKSWQASWTEKNPGYTYELWDDDDNRKFIEDNYPDFLPIYDGYDKTIKRADVIRYFYLYTYGGIYADLDFQCLKNFDPIIAIESDVILGSLGKMDNARYGLHVLPNAIMLAKPKADFFKFVIQVLYNIGVNNTLGPECATGPVLLFLCLHYYVYRQKNEQFVLPVYGKDIFANILNVEFGSNITVTDPLTFYPINWDDQTHRQYYTKSETPEELFPSSYAVTYWMHSW